MALGLSNGSSGGDFLPIVKWDARAGRFFRVDRSQGANGWESNDVDLTMDKPKFCVDLGSIEVGFMAFLPTGPDFHLTPYGNPMPEKPSKDHKAGFKVRLAGNALNGVREFSSSAKSVLAAMDNLHSAFEAAPEAVDDAADAVDGHRRRAPGDQDQPVGSFWKFCQYFEGVGPRWPWYFEPMSPVP